MVTKLGFHMKVIILYQLFHSWLCHALLRVSSTLWSFMIGLFIQNLCFKSFAMPITLAGIWRRLTCTPGPVFCLLLPSKLRLCSASHRAGYFSKLACDWLSMVWAYSEQEPENRPCCVLLSKIHAIYVLKSFLAGWIMGVGGAFQNSIWVRSQNCGCLVTWFCYQLIAKPGNKTATVSWPYPYELLNLRALRISTTYEIYTFHCIAKIFCVEFQW